MRVLTRYQKYRKKIFAVYFALFLGFGYTSLLDAIPDTISVERGNVITIGNHLPVTKTVKTESGAVESFSTNVCGTYQLECRLFGLIPVKDVTVNIVDGSEVIPCGVPMGIYIETSGVLVIDTGEVEDSNGNIQNPSRHILRKGDYIMKAGQKEIEKKEDLIAAVNQCNGESVVLSILRDGEEMDCEIQPVLLEDGTYKIGAWVRDDLAGIGTMTYVDGNGNYGALGHGISDTDTESVVDIKQGTAYLTEILSIVKGQKGTPGELVGQIQYDNSHKIGTIDQNTTEGIFGNLDVLPEELRDVSAIPIGYKQEIENGPAQMLVELDGAHALYDIEIESVDMNAQTANKSICLRVTDEELLEKTGGIVQGLSGSPIIQNGKLVGAVTHVFVNDPAKGYGIFIENMLEHN